MRLFGYCPLFCEGLKYWQRSAYCKGIKVTRSRICPFAEMCPLYTIYPPSKLNELRHAYCVADYDRCERRIMRLGGDMPAIDLLPDGTTLTVDDSDPTVYTVV
jgi:hypothetical protein